MANQIELYGKQIPYNGQSLGILGDSFGANFYELDITALQANQGKIPQTTLVETLGRILEQQRKVVAQAQVMDNIKGLLTVDGLGPKIEKAKNTIGFLEDALPLLR